MVNELAENRYKPATSTTQRGGKLLSDSSSQSESETSSSLSTSSLKKNIFSGVYLATITGVAVAAGFGYTIAAAKKRDPDSFSKGLVRNAQKESGPQLALRALKWGTFYSVTGFSLFCFGVWKLMGVNNLSEFREKCGNKLPRVPRNNPPQSRTEFSGLTDLLEHIIELSDKSKTKNKPD